ncbi:putative conserved oligomeric Golgi complex subunit 5-like [Trypanosoma rangeli]|uniref:Conserved oligomeric Golgi complex subunit 5 n=1 Tax=Trypanosoma rangeli TaxID=5698 RepID=A0A422NYH4_TRYRA|nr:putative conserved oligomeric Golgi complex subunit 5-like [Trypanosoma rangeli]RNF10553.1 putative conserved oligomeric Golgi complex subunit 5-like [Trypanosoma rangeli]|eukprot:RNF10553.1 putative conserved oligomeric Golgi complex subunit 5-like [Trypanosoma rangeli]
MQELPLAVMFADSTLMSSDFDEEAYLRYALHASNCQAEQARLASCAKAVREEVHKILSENTEDMLQQVTAACRAQRDVAAVRQATASLVNSTSRLRHTVQEPYRIINANITKLQNTSAALTTLRSILRFLDLTTRLKSQLPQDLARASRTLREVEELLQASNLKGIEVVDARMDAVERAAVTIRTKAQEMLRRGDAQDASGVAISLQCLFTLGSLPRVLGTLMTEQKREVIRSLMRDLDLQAMIDEVSHGTGTTANDVNLRTREVLFTHIKSALANVSQHTQVVVAVWCVLVKRVDPTTQTPYLSAVESPTSVLGDYWQIVTEKLRERLQAVQKRPSFLAALAADVMHYHSLLNCFLGSMDELLKILDCLVEYDAAAAKQATGSSLFVQKVTSTTATNTTAAASEELKRAWLSQVTREVDERFAAHILDRHRERLHHILSKLQTILPTAGGRSTVNVVVDLQRPEVPAAAHALDTRAYTMLATQDVMMYRQNSHTLSVVLNCILQCLTAFMQPVTAATGKWPLSPLPAVSGDATVSQLLHICVSNACTQLCTDLTAVLALLQEGNAFTAGFVNKRWAPAGAGHEEQKKKLAYASSDQNVVMDKYHQLRDLAKEFTSMSEHVVQPFFKSLAVLLLDSVLMCVDGTPEQAAAGIGQLHSQMGHFMSHFYYLFEPQTPMLDEQSRGLTNKLLARLIVAVALVYPFTTSTQQHLINCLQQITHVVLSFGPTSTHGTVGRSTVSLKGQLHQLTVWYSLPEEVHERPVGEWHNILQTLPPVVTRLLLLQRVLHSSSKVKKPYTLMGMTSGGFMELLESIVLGQLHTSDTLPHGLIDGGGGSPEMMRLGEVLGAVERCFHEATAASREDAVRGPTMQWMENLWALLKD